jgi:flagellar hook-basal body complex protein FliE
MITPIEQIGRLGANASLSGVSNDTSTGTSTFYGVFQNAIQNVKDTNSDLVQAQYLLSTGQLDNPATVTIAASKSELAVELLVQLRNKALDAYSQLTQISL